MLSLSAAVTATIGATVALGLLIAFTFTGAGAGSLASAVAVAFPFALMAMLAYCTRHKKPLIGFLLYFGVIIGALMIAASLYVPRSDADNEVMTSLFIFFGVLPLCNALFDYVSMGLTRWLLRQGATNVRSAVLFGFIDLIAAAIAFTALGCTLIGFIHLLNLVAVQPFFDFVPLFEGLKDPNRWREHILIYAMIFSTFVPTFIHFAIACFSLVAWTPNQLKDWILEGLTSGETIAISGGVFALSALVSFVIVFPLWLVIFVGKMLLAHYPIIGTNYLCWFESFARLIGAFA